MLKDEIKAIIGNRRKFLLLRIADVEVETARSLCRVKKGTYNSWLQDSRFVELYRRRDEFATAYKVEAIQLLRRDNQLSAVLLESRIIERMRAEVESGKYELLRTNLAKEVYSKLIADLDYQPQALSLTWEQRVQQLIGGEHNPQLGEGEIIDGEVITETVNSQTPEHPQSLSVTGSVQESPQV